eukprot:CAMPEP_0174720782 /NCGR_PEP_ID=MMETSP1094-20130205/34471_1 /TAXON_ID=156173 /ORGANISM="Chrysochromulina brevifilum, Strain UTEX LB 985" /LENGTH=32 /DNA_ID= /DNA_START= /DNA_END= /DNA_ORIENTATION=
MMIVMEMIVIDTFVALVFIFATFALVLALICT